MDEFDVDAGGQGVGGGSVPQVVQADGWQVVFAHEFVELVRELRGVQGLSVGVGEDQVGVRPSLAEGGWSLPL